MPSKKKTDKKDDAQRPAGLARFDSDAELKEVDHAAVELGLTRSEFMAAAALEKARSTRRRAVPA